MVGILVVELRSAVFPSWVIGHRPIAALADDQGPMTDDGFYTSASSRSSSSSISSSSSSMPMVAGTGTPPAGGCVARVARFHLLFKIDEEVHVVFEQLGAQAESVRR